MLLRIQTNIYAKNTRWNGWKQYFLIVLQKDLIPRGIIFVNFANELNPSQNLELRMKICGTQEIKSVKKS